METGENLPEHKAKSFKRARLMMESCCLALPWRIAKPVGLTSERLDSLNQSLRGLAQLDTVAPGKDHVEECCYDPGPYHQFSAIFRHLFLRSQSLVPHSFPHAPLGPPPNHLTSHLMNHLTIPQSDITCHHSAVRSTPQYHHLTPYELPAHCYVMIDHQLMMELYLELPAHDEPYYM